MSAETPTIVWFREDLRLSDNPALDAAVERGGPVVPVFVLDDEAAGSWAWGGASRWWLHHSLDSLASDLESAGSGLVLRRGDASEVLPSLVEETGAGAVYWNRRYEPFAMEADGKLKQAFNEDGINAKSFNGALLHEPWTLRTGKGDPYKVFTPFWKALASCGDPEAPLAAPKKFPKTKLPDGDGLDDWDLLPSKPDWAGGLRERWTVGESAARERLEDFLDGALSDYSDDRDRPDRTGTSRLSPHLHWGEISPRQVWHLTRDKARASGGKTEKQSWSFLRELAWREFCYHLLVHFPDLPHEAWREEFASFPWESKSKRKKSFDAWSRGQTGYPIVDAGMRELWNSGWMHNRVRMIAASFLIKDLLVPWQEGEAWFWDTLVDADLANNAASWQWVAGSGADAAPYFRIFNPVLQSEKFDPDGAYIRRWVPEIADLPDKHVHAPWDAPEDVLKEAGIRLGDDYPEPIVDHAAARKRALAAYDEVKKGGSD